MEKNGIKELLIYELQDILNAEQQIVEALPDMISAVQSADLKSALEAHRKETQDQILRLEKIFMMLNVQKKEMSPKGIKGLIGDIQDVLKDFPTSSPLRDAALISKAQRIEHFEIAAYGALRSYAQELDLDDIDSLLANTMDEEGNADKKLTKLAEGGLFKTGINVEANKQETTKQA